ncbi:hypothetical protein [Gracilibacillus xinjiangensis]|uniref:Uncharacterized protein n=1 Tax=Gracilibacillus xinjiangensis TaxID=1193282 RepID=A0ABV8WU89_9BACI
MAAENKKKRNLVLFAVLAVIIIIAVAAYVFNNQDQTNPDADPVATTFKNRDSLAVEKIPNGETHGCYPGETTNEGAEEFLELKSGESKSFGPSDLPKGSLLSINYSSTFEELDIYLANLENQSLEEATLLQTPIMKYQRMGATTFC